MFSVNPLVTVRRQLSAQRQQLLPVRSVQLLGLALAPADEADLVAQPGQTPLQRLVLGSGQNLKAVECGLCFAECFVRLAHLLAQHLGAVLVAAEVHRQLLLELGALFGRSKRGVANGLPGWLAGELNKRRINTK